jgi:DNA-binding LacI/PurR family transcriptional regulator
VAVTLRDVAARAGVSPRTVSNVVNNYHYVSPAMRARVQAALDELNYKPNLLARSLRRGQTGIINLLLPRIAAPYFGELAHAVVEEARRLGFSVLIDETSGQPTRELALLEVATRSRWVDGVLLSPLGLDGRALAGLRRSSIPVVLLGERTGKATHDHLSIDNVSASRDAAQHLIDQGRRRIGAVGGSAGPADVVSRRRLRGYLRALRDAGLPAQEHHYAPAPDYTRGQAAAAVRSMLADGEPPDGLVCFTAELAIGALRELSDHGIGVPSDISIVAFDDVEECQFATPSLSSVGPDKTEVARIALEMLIERMDGLQVGPRDVHLAYQLIPRESSTRS